MPQGPDAIVDTSNNLNKNSFEVKHCKTETVFILRSAQAGKLKKTYI